MWEGSGFFCSILGFRIHNLTYEQALGAIETFIAEGIPRQVVTLNPELVMLSFKDPEFRAIVNSAALVLPDGVGLLWASRMLGCPLRERVTGVDTVERFAELASRKGYRPFLLGAAPGVAERAAANLARRHPGFGVAGTYAGSPSPAEEDEIVGMIRQSGADILFVAYGSPAQEKWIARNLRRLGVPVAMGVGGAFDFIAGVVPRAPAPIRRVGLEWLFRLVIQPWRWRRQLALAEFVILVLKERSRMRRG